MAAAHYKLQHSLLVIETEEAAKRMEVEHEMTRREVEILQAAELARREASSQPPEQSTASTRYIAELKAYCETMDKENALLHRRLERAKIIIAEKEEDINDLLSENHRYVGRIRENREHMRLLRSPGGLYASASTPRTQSQNFPTTPQYTRATPKHTPHSIHQHDSQDSFATLLLADRVLNDQNSAPTTPTITRFTQRSNSQVKHSRNVQSLSSLPSTPIRNSGQSQHLLPSVQFIPQSEPRYRTSQSFFSPSQPARTALPHGRTEKRRKSRDSTISASDAEELAAYSQPQVHPSQETRNSDDTEELESDDVQESQASVAASAMLRRDPRESFEVAVSPGLGEATEKGALLQAKIFGSVTKGASAPKRKRLPDDEEVRAKKLRMAAGEGVGLGIYGP
jgi:acetyl-CoA acyltransferase 1